MFKFLLPLALSLVTILHPLAFAQSLPARASAGELTAEQANLDMRVLRRALLALHPALTKYRTQAEIDAGFVKFESRAAAARSAAEMYLAATELATAIRDGHTWANVLNQSGAVKVSRLESANKLSLTVTVVEGRWLVLASADVAIQNGAEDESLRLSTRAD
jgi:hypothetical protein